jgi:hypothetical protein
MTRRASSAVAPLLLALAMLSRAAMAASPDRGDERRIRDRFVGAWRLVWLEEPGADGKVHKADCTGMLVFTREGRMSVQVLYREPRVGTAAASVQYAQGGYEASFGRYVVDVGAGTFTYRVEGALVRTLMGKELTRRFELSGNQLVVGSSDAGELWRVAWR